MKIYVKPELVIRLQIQNTNKIEKESVITFKNTGLTNCIDNIHELFETNKEKIDGNELHYVLRFREFLNNKGGAMRSLHIYGLTAEQIVLKIQKFYLKD